MPSSRLLALFPLALLQACVYVPRTREVYDAGCQVVYKQMVLEAVQMRGAEHCTRGPVNAECLVAALGSGFTVVASAVVSGSIVIAGNTLYWLGSAPRPAEPAAPHGGMSKVAEPHLLMKQGNCRPVNGPPA
jgi:hypothetical protein